MNLISAFVLYAVVWFMCLFIALPLRLKSQDEEGEVVPGTPGSAPVDPKLGKKVKWVTVFATIVWGILCAIIISGVITIEDIDFFNRL